jgi:hypothetical protein
MALGIREMNLVKLVRSASSAPLSEALFDAACKHESVDRQKLYDAFAREVAEGYGSGKYSWPDSDVAMNHLFAFAHAVTGEGLSDYAFSVYQAFDEGEYKNGGESVTNDLLAKLK